jgi:GNAT superfamily N-acetyltransferase
MTANEPTLTITLPTAADRGDVVRLLRAQLAEHRIETGADAVSDAVDGVFADGRRGFIVLAKEAGVAVGVAYASSTWSLEHGGKSCWLEELYVVPARRGQGIGSRLLSSVLERARAEGCAAVDLEVDEEHRRAAGLYARNGFRSLPRARWVTRL